MWGTDIIEEAEAEQSDFCKWILRINIKATNIMAGGEFTLRYRHEKKRRENQTRGNRP